VSARARRRPWFRTMHPETGLRVVGWHDPREPHRTEAEERRRWARNVAGELWCELARWFRLIVRTEAPR